MVANVKPTGRAMSMPAGLALSGGVSLCITILISAITAFLTEREIIPESAIGYYVMGLLLIAAAAGGITAIKKIKRRKLLAAALSGLIYYGELLAITALFFGGQYQAMGVTALMVLAGSALPLLMSGQGRGAVKRKHYKTPSR